MKSFHIFIASVLFDDRMNPMGGEFKPPMMAAADPPPPKKKRRGSAATNAAAAQAAAPPPQPMHDIFPPPMPGKLGISSFNY